MPRVVRRGRRRGCQRVQLINSHADILGVVAQACSLVGCLVLAEHCDGLLQLRNGRVDEASEVYAELKANHPDSIMAQLGDAILSGVCGKHDAAHDAITSELRAAARNSELLSREITHCLALAGKTDEALDWLENTVRIGNINYPFWAQHNEWVDSIRGNSRFDAIMRDVEREWMSVTSSG